MTGKTRQLTVLVVGQHAEPVRRLHLPRRLLLQGGAIVGAVALAGVVILGHYLSLLPEAGENRALRAENAELRALMGQVKDRLAAVAATVERVERYDQRLRTAVTRNEDPERALAIGPIAGPDVPREGPPPAASQGLAALPVRVAALGSHADRRERSLRELQEYLDDRDSLLASTPSLLPTRGWATSEFGPRHDPVNAEHRMHEGLDIATDHGRPVVAPSDGTVVFKGWEGGYGNVLVIDHGFGVKTRFGHLHQILVNLGDQVKRGTRVAHVGNTGKSTGPHLHYEVRVNGVPENPRKFVLE
ncbi:MAG TPA: M23 family metallopeptidase [Anaeromyxobacteraceae bacterium]|jgi:murein DD-endopeptidase MepM/ murein hydrolase activator NlpD